MAFRGISWGSSPESVPSPSHPCPVQIKPWTDASREDDEMHRYDGRGVVLLENMRYPAEINGDLMVI